MVKYFCDVCGKEVNSDDVISSKEITIEGNDKKLCIQIEVETVDINGGEFTEAAICKECLTKRVSVWALGSATIEKCNE